ncbi:nucleotidyltransferase domain-containing protein [Actinopolymorpha alba]|uniref:nucleotidyltransferase domain-containing protein n=1 Tax=Actinopolymorpha alba TaxID=533267 RepID=UPI0003629CAA|nr:nucleotidyltransferase domain-containing protein [Actinopolymorpha alba]
MAEPAEALAVARAHAERLTAIGGVVGVMVGGSHARGAADASSDLDLGVYYREPLDLDALRALASEVVGRPTDVAAPGGWGPWVNGGAWLDTEIGPVDWILRDVDRVRGEWDRARRGEFSLHHQAGHPFGFVSTTYVGEVATGIVVADPGGELTALKSAAAAYPEPLRDAFVGWLWEAEFSLAIARKAASRGDAAYVAMGVTHAVGIMAHALHASCGRWVLNEKGLITAAAGLPAAPAEFGTRAHAACAGGDDPTALAARLHDAEKILEDVRTSVSTDHSLPQDRLDQAFRTVMERDTRVRAALTYGSRVAGLGDAYSDVEYWVFVDDEALERWEPAAWIGQVGEPDLLVQNEFGAWVAVNDGRVRVEVHFWPASDLDVVRSWPARGAPVAAMVIVDRDGRLAPALRDLPELAPVPRTPEEVAELCGRFANWWILGRNVLARGELERAHDALSHVRRHLLWLARLDEGATTRWLTPSRLAEQDLSEEVLEALRRVGGSGAGSAALAEAYVAAWELGSRLWQALARTWGFGVPRLLDTDPAPHFR